MDTLVGLAASVPEISAGERGRTGNTSTSVVDLGIVWVYPTRAQWMMIVSSMQQNRSSLCHLLGYPKDHGQ